MDLHAVGKPLRLRNLHLSHLPIHRAGPFRPDRRGRSGFDRSGLRRLEKNQDPILPDHRFASLSSGKTGLRPRLVPHAQRRRFRADFLEDANTEVPKRREAIASICNASAVS